jgi:4-aminobutyrate aminotransferase-like enzyme
MAITPTSPETSEQAAGGYAAGGGGDLQELAKRHLWMHFTRMGVYEDSDVPVIVRGDGCYVYDEHGKRYLDGLSALYCVNIGHGRAELGQAAARQAEELGFYTNWSYAHPRSIELAARIAELAPGRPEPRVLHIRGVGGGRVGVEAREGLPRREGRADEDKADLA